jgi:hypothetical protein
MNLRARFTPSREKPAGPGPADRCGCAMGAKFMGVGFAGSTAWNLYQWPAHSVGGMCGRVVLISFAAAILGKIAGIVWYRLRYAGLPAVKPRARRRKSAQAITAEGRDAGIRAGVSA